MKIPLEIFVLLIVYIIGSIPFGYLFTKKIIHQDIRKLGSGNIGSTNVKRVAGRKVSIMTQLSDMLKGLLPVAIILFLQNQKITSFSEDFIYLVAFASILGHDFSFFLKFKGGKGVNTTLGASILLSPVPVLISVLIYFIVKKLTKYVSLSSICLAITLALSELILHNVTHLLYYLIACCSLIIIMHISNIYRLLNGTESKSN